MAADAPRRPQARQARFGLPVAHHCGVCLFAATKCPLNESSGVSTNLARMLLYAHQPTDPWAVVTAIGTAIAAIAACVSAMASSRAAASSAKTSEHATEALATTIVPGVGARGVYQHEGTNPPEAYVAVNNDVDFLARDIEVEVIRRDGRRFKGERDLLRHDDQPLVVEIGELDASTPSGNEFLVVATVTTRFSDERKLARYERVEQYGHLTEAPATPDVSEKRLWPSPGPFLRQPARLS